MNLDQFFEHWQVTENPFRGEEARHDAVFARMARLNEVAANAVTRGTHATHSDFEKIVGSFESLSTAVVFGEKGSGKTAIRLQITREVASHNVANPDNKVFLIAYDDLNAFLDRLHKRLGHKDPAKSLDGIRLVDHIDALLSIGTRSIAERVSGDSAGGGDLKRAARRLAPAAKRDLLLLNAVYGAGDRASASLSRTLRVGRPRAEVIAWLLTMVGWVPAAAALYYGGFGGLRNAGPRFGEDLSSLLVWAGLALAIVWLMPMAKWQVWDRLKTNRVGKRLRKQVRVLDKSDVEYGRSLRTLPKTIWNTTGGAALPVTETDETRYDMLSRFTRVTNGLGFGGVMVLVDRVDEPTLISGDPRRMKSVIWPMLNNKFLQQEGFALKMLLPIELRYELFRESSAFFQEARLDKQNLVERLSWTGSMLYDLCDARLNACRGRDGEVGRRDGETKRLRDEVEETGNGATEGDVDDGAVGGGDGAGSGAALNKETLTLLDMFESDVTLKDIVDALDQMHQPRDAFKFLYQCIAEHCSNVTAEEGAWRVPRLVLEIVRKQQSERVQALQRGIRPA